MLNKIKRNINIIEDYKIIDSKNSNDILSLYNYKGKIKYDIYKAPYYKSLLISIADEKDYRITIAKRKSENCLGIGIDIIDLRRIKKHNVPFFFYETEKQIKTNDQYARIIALKEASFKAMSDLYRQKRIKTTIFDFEITNDIFPHDKSKKIITPLNATIKHQCFIIDDYCFAVVSITL